MSTRGATQPTVMSVHDHLKELRGRLFQIVLAFIVFSAAAYAYRDYVINALLLPLHGEKLAYLTVGGGFAFIFTVTMWCGLACTLPVIVYHLYKFIAPALPSRAQKNTAVLVVLSFLLLISGAAFGYYLAIPGALRFLLTFGDGYVNAMLTADSYLNFMLVYTIGLGLLFQIPLLMVITHWIHPLKPLKLLKFERYVIVAAFILAAFITPTPDALNQTIIALPIILMYQAGVIAVWWALRREKRQSRSTDAPAVAVSPRAMTKPLSISAATPVRKTMDVTGAVRPARSADRVSVPERAQLSAQRGRPRMPLRAIDGISPYTPARSSR